MKYERLGQGFIFIQYRNRVGIPFLVDGTGPEYIKYGDFVYLAKGEFHNEPKKTTWMIEKNENGGKYIQFFVHYISSSGTQGARIPYTEQNLKLFKQITTSHNGTFIAFRTEETNNPLINGIGTTWYSNHKTKEYGGKWLFWDIK